MKACMAWLRYGAVLLGLCSPAAWADPAQAPVVFNAPASAKAGDIVGLQGAFFGSAPQVALKTPDGEQLLPLINQHGEAWLSFRLPADAPPALSVRVSNGTAWSTPVFLNRATPHHLDALRIAPSGVFRLFGRSLLSPGLLPSVTVDGQAASVDLQASTAQMLVLRAPTRLQPGTQPLIQVDNGNGSGPTTLERGTTVVAGGQDVWGLGVGWAGGFEKLAARNVVLGADGQAVCQGQADDTPVVQAAMDKLAASGGGVLQLPAGNCRFAGSLQLRSKVVLRGQGQEQTRIRYEASYPVMGRALDLAGVTDLSLQGTRAGIESPLLQNSSRVFFKNVRFELGGGLHMFWTGNRDFVVADCDIVQAINPGHNGVYVLTDSAGLVFRNNRTAFAHGAPAFTGVHDAFINDNLFLRDIRATADSKDVVHSMALDFAHKLAVVGNTFDVLGGPVRNKFRNDGETILSEGGGGARTESLGVVSAATATTLNIGAGEPVPLPQRNYAVAIVSGTGAGQARRVTSVAGNTLTVDAPWAVLPDAGSRYAAFAWGLEKALIQGNTLRQNPRGIWLYQTALRDVDILDNRISEGGGIYIRTAQNRKDRLFTPVYGLRIEGNQISNTTGEWRSYISLMFVRMDIDDFGVASTGVEIRNNQLIANVPNLTQAQEESGAAEGFVVRMHAEGPSQAMAKFQTRLLGTVLQDNRCSGCATGVIVREGAQATVQDGNTNQQK